MALMFGLGLGVVSARAELIVIAVSGTNAFVPGQQIKSEAKISLGKDARITVLSKSGELRVIDGPFEDAVSLTASVESDDGDGDRWQSVKAFLGHPDAQSEVLGASRRLDGEVPPPPGIWYVSVDSSGPRCTAPNEITLWRRTADQDQTIAVRTAASSLKDVSWMAGENTLRLPEGFSIESGRMIVGIGGKLRELDLHVYPGSVEATANGSLLEWMIDRKCGRQALSLIRHVHAKVDVN